jgi:predicted lipoprotein with Yx(FWY)xxD motif
MTKSAKFLLKRFCTVGLSLTLLGSLSLGAISCSKDSAEPVVDQDAVANVKLATSATLGSYMTDAAGNTLYVYAKDVAGTNNCTSVGCNAAWPIYYEANIKVPKALNAADFATKTTTDGRLQTTYKGWPLYYFATSSNGIYTREATGVTSGNGVGGNWVVVNPGYSVLLGNKSVEDKTTHVVTSKSYLVDANGRTMYYFAKDDTHPTTLATNCTGGCASIWPPVYMSAPTIPSTLLSRDFTTISRDGGARQQLLYKGHPLYYYAGDDATRGQVEGHNLMDSGDLWFVAAP